MTAKASELERMRERADPRKKEPKLQRELRQASDTAFSKVGRRLLLPGSKV